MGQQKQGRKRGVVLTRLGLARLQGARRQAEVREHAGEPYTLEELGDRTGLTSFTVAKVLNHRMGVDKQTLICFFNAFELELTSFDYVCPSPSTDQSIYRKDTAGAHPNSARLG